MQFLRKNNKVKFKIVADGKVEECSTIGYTVFTRYRISGSMMTMSDQVPEIMQCIIKALRLRGGDDGLSYEQICLMTDRGSDVAPFEGDFDMVEVLGIMLGEGMLMQSADKNFHLWGKEYDHTDVFQDGHEDKWHKPLVITKGAPGCSVKVERKTDETTGEPL